MVHIEKIENQVPFGHAVFVQLKLHNVPFNDLPGKNRIEKSYLAWETVRRKTNPYFVTGTGFEGYLVGTCETPEAALESILKINRHILDAIARLYHRQFKLQSRLMKTLSGEQEDRETIHIWSSYLGAELGRLRIQIPHNIDAGHFQNQTYGMVAMLPPIAYHSAETNIIQDYEIGYPDNPVTIGKRGAGKLDIKTEMLNPSQQAPWHVAINIGRFGHPLVRSFLDKVWQ